MVFPLGSEHFVCEGEAQVTAWGLFIGMEGTPEGLPPLSS